jgi:hypothetical protein
MVCPANLSAVLTAKERGEDGTQSGCVAIAESAEVKAESWGYFPYPLATGALAVFF